MKKNFFIIIFFIFALTQKSFSYSSDPKQFIQEIVDEAKKILVNSNTKEFKTEFISASITFTSGSTKFGDSIDDNHNMTGSLKISGSVTADSFVGILSQSAQIASDISGSLSSTAIASLGASIVSGSTQLATDISGSFTGELSGSHIKFIGGGVRSERVEKGSH